MTLNGAVIFRLFAVSFFSTENWHLKFHFLFHIIETDLCAACDLFLEIGLCNTWNNRRLCIRQFGRGEVQISFNFILQFDLLQWFFIFPFFFIRFSSGFVVVFFAHAHSHTLCGSLTDRWRLHWIQYVVARWCCLCWQRIHMSRVSNVVKDDRKGRFDCIQSIEMAHGALWLYSNVVRIEWKSDCFACFVRLTLFHCYYIVITV